MGKTEAQLKQRMDESPHLKVASSFRDEHTAEQAVSTALEKNHAAIDQWLKRPRDDLVIFHKGESSLGIAVDRGVPAARSGNVARIVLRPDPEGGFYVLTAYLN